jgi:mRNA interferase MazF
MKRGDIVTVALQGDYGKPRPALVIESDRLPATEGVLICLITSTVHEDTRFRRHAVDASPSTGLRVLFHVMVDKIFAVRGTKCGPHIGELDAAAMLAVSRKLALLTGIADCAQSGRYHNRSVSCHRPNGLELGPLVRLTNHVSIQNQDTMAPGRSILPGRPRRQFCGWPLETLLGVRRRHFLRPLRRHLGSGVRRYVGHRDDVMLHARPPHWSHAAGKHRGVGRKHG